MSQRQGHYLVEDVIGVGSFATVHRATDERLNAPVVLKMLAENHSLNPEIRERFIAEARSLRRVEGPHVVTIHDMGQTERQQPYLVLEFADRGSLAQRVAQLQRAGWRATTDDLLVFARSLAAAVDAVHQAQLVHRDLSPGNLLLASKPSSLNDDASSALHSAVIPPDERLLIADLGMCKDLALNSGLTVSGGTSEFRPPEQSGPGIVDYRADIWAMSALLMWLGRDAKLSSALTKVLKRGMADKPQRRQRTAAAWLEEVEQALVPPAPEPVAPEPSVAHQAAQTYSPSSGTEAPVSAGAAKKTRTAPWKRNLVLVLLGFMLVAGVLLGRWIFADTSAPLAETDNASLSIDGPEQIQVGETAEFNAEVVGVDSWVWSLPSGRFITDDDEVSITATSPGSAEVILRSRTSDGQELETRHQLHVVD